MRKKFNFSSFSLLAEGYLWGHLDDQKLIKMKADTGTFMDFDFSNSHSRNQKIKLFERLRVRTKGERKSAGYATRFEESDIKLVYRRNWIGLSREALRGISESSLLLLCIIAHDRRVRFSKFRTQFFVNSTN